MTASPVSAPGGRGPGWARPLVCGVLPAALLTTLIAVPAATWSRLPAQVADHWTVAGTADGASPRLAVFLLTGGLALVGAAIVVGAWAAARRAARGGGPGQGQGRAPGAAAVSVLPVLAGTGLFLMAVATAAVILVTVANAGITDWRSASVGPGGLAGMIAGPVALAAGAMALLRRHGVPGMVNDGAPRPSLGLRAGERAVWIGQARARWPWPAGMGLLAAAAVLGLLARWEQMVAVGLLACLVPLGFSMIRVTVTARGVTVGYGMLGFRLTRFPLRRIARADAVARTASGLGYRGGLAVLGAAAVVLRRGPALSLTLRDGKTFLVSVDDAQTGAALLNDLIAAAPVPPA